MGVSAPNQPPTIVYPPEGARGVPTDASAWGHGGTVQGHPPPFRFEVAGAAIATTYEVHGYVSHRTPMGVESYPISRIKPANALPTRAHVALVYQARTLVSFETGDGPAPSGTARPCAPPPQVGPLGPRMSPTGEYVPARHVSLELGDGAYLVTAGPMTWVVSGPGARTFAVCDGERLHVRDAQLRTVFQEP